MRCHYVNEIFLKLEQLSFYINDFVTICFDRLLSHGEDIAFKNNLIFDITQLDFNPKALEVGAAFISTFKGYITLACYILL